jgi:DNA polymerase-3 subunit alpha (Gram-positive type)
MESYIVFDLETTGINPFYEEITEIGAIKVEDGKVVDEFNELINPLKTIPEDIMKLTGITNEMVKKCPTINEVLPNFLEFAEDDSIPLIGHNIIFDYSFIKHNAFKIGKRFERKGIDTLHIARKTLKHLESRSLSFLTDHFDMTHENAHRAFNDTLATYELFQYLKTTYEANNKELFEAKPLHWKPKKESPITDKQRKYLLALLHQHNISLNIHIDTLTKREASKKIDEINFQYGRRA